MAFLLGRHFLSHPATAVVTAGMGIVAPFILVPFLAATEVQTWLLAWSTVNATLILDLAAGRRFTRLTFRGIFPPGVALLTACNAALTRALTRVEDPVCRERAKIKWST